MCIKIQTFCFVWHTSVLRQNGLMYHQMASLNSPNMLICVAKISPFIFSITVKLHSILIDFWHADTKINLQQNNKKTVYLC